jgi:hypothetical protein
MSAPSTSNPLPTWADQIRALEPVGDRLMAKWGRADPTEAERQDMYRLALSALSGGYLAHVYLDPARPVWAPLWNIAINLAGPAPDYVYMTAEIDPAGVYRISGFRGGSCFVEITQQSWEMIGGGGARGPVPASDDLDDLHIGPDGYFSVILSAERPAGYAGDWWRLHPQVIRLLMRKCSRDWLHEIDARVAIDRLDERPAATPEEFARRFSNMAAWIEKVISFDIDLARYYREHHGINVLERSKLIDSMGGLPAQIYYDGAYEITDAEALIVDTALPATCRYWSILVADDRFSTVDWVNRQSSLNGAQARIDGDGRFRAVISAKDPGVANWLDKADNPWGIIQLRWNRPSDAPDPVVTRVALADVREHLPPETPILTAAERKEQLRVRREGAQMRQLW